MNSAWALGALALGLTLVARPSIVLGDVPEALLEAPIVDTEIAGETAGITSIDELGIPQGATLTRELVRSAITRLVATERWADVQIDAIRQGAGVRLVVHLVPRLRAARIEVSGNSVMDDDEVLRGLGLSVGAELDRAHLPAVEHDLAALYAERGYRATHVQLILRDTDDPFEKVLVIRVNEGSATRVTAIRFIGPVPPGLDARAIVHIDVGDVLDHRAIDRAIREAETNVRSSGYYEARFEDPTLTDLAHGGVSVDVPAHFGPKYTVRIRSYAPLTRGDVLSVLGLGAERLSTAQTQPVLRERVVELYQRHGFQDATASVTRSEDESGTRGTLEVVVAAGPQVEVRDLTFPGATHFTNAFLRDQIYSYLEEDLPGSSLFSSVDSSVVDDVVEREGGGGRTVARPLVVDPARTFFAPTYAQAIEHVRELYQVDGYLQAQVGPAELRRIDREHASVVVPVVEGPQTLLAALSLAGNHQISDRDVVEVVQLSALQPFSNVALEEARLHVLELYRDRGYFYATVDPEVRFSTDHTRAEITLRIVERFPVSIGSITVRGLSRTSETLVLERLSFEPGDLYRPTLAQESQDRLLELGIFTSVLIAPEDVDLPARVKNVVVSVTERPAQFLDVTGGVSTGEGVRSAFEYGYRNFFGYAISASFRVQVGYQFFFIDPVLQQRFDQLSLADRLERRITGVLALPHIGRLRGVRASLTGSIVRDNERDFGYDTAVGALTLTYRLQRRFTVSLSESIERNNIGLFVAEALDDYLRMTTDPRLQRLLRVPEGVSVLAETQATTTIDFRDSPFNATRGFTASLVLGWAHTISTEAVSTGAMTQTQFFSNFLKATLAVTGYIPLSSRVILALQGRIGGIYHLDAASKTYPNRAYFLGGVDTMRGYLQDALVPQDIANRIRVDPTLDPNAIVRGGDAFIVLRAELRFPIVGPLQGAAFTDIGNLWADASQFRPWELRPTAGLGIRLATPIGPIALDYGVILVRRAVLEEPFGALHFSIGVF